MSTRAEPPVDVDEGSQGTEETEVREVSDPYDAPGLAELVYATRDLGGSNARLRLAVARHLDLAVTDVIALIHLQVNGSMSQRELAEGLGVSPSAVTVMVDRLEPLGLMTRIPDPRDRRRTLVHVYSPDEDPLGLYRAIARPYLRLSEADRREATRLVRLLIDIVRDSADEVEKLPSRTAQATPAAQAARAARAAQTRRTAAGEG